MSLYKTFDIFIKQFKSRRTFLKFVKILKGLLKPAENYWSFVNVVWQFVRVTFWKCNFLKFLIYVISHICTNFCSFGEIRWLTEDYIILLKLFEKNFSKFLTPCRRFLKYHNSFLLKLPETCAWIMRGCKIFSELSKSP